MKRGRGRPRGTGKRWTDFTDAQIWARIEFIRWRDKTRRIDRAAQIMADEGYLFVRNGRSWMSRSFDPDDGDHVRLIESKCKPGHSRSTKTAEHFRRRYYIAKRRTANPAFYSDCKFWLSVFKSMHNGDDDPIETALRH